MSWVLKRILPLHFLYFDLIKTYTILGDSDEGISKAQVGQI